jgi:hypothetical protein
MISTKDIRVSVHTTWWNKKENTFGFYPAWPVESFGENQLEAYNEILNKDAKYAASNKRRGIPARVNNVSLYTALTNKSRASAYLVQYKPTSLRLRLRTQLFDTKYRQAYDMYRDVSPNGVEMHLAIIDMDCHGGDATSWFRLQKPKLDQLQADFPGLLVWRSMNGFRILGLLPEPFLINSREDARKWTRQYTAWCKFLSRKYMLKTAGKETADQLGDWTRYQRVPHDTRVWGEPASELPFYGNPEFVGYWNPPLIEEDWPKEIVVRSTEHRDYTGHCQLHTCIVQSGLRCEATENPSIYDIHCPAHEEHSETEDRRTKTRLYINGPIGKIECKSSSCQASHPDKMKSYLRHFPTEMVKATAPARNWRNQPLVAELFEQRITEQKGASLEGWFAGAADTTWTTFEQAKISSMGLHDRDKEDVKLFARWFATQQQHTDHKSIAAWQAWLDSCTQSCKL